MSLALKSVLAWVVLLAVMIVNGMSRVLILQPRFGELAARQIASIIGIGIVFLAAWIFVGLLARPTRAQLMAVGIIWLVLTVGFEFSFGRLVAGASWDVLLADYNLLDGRLWPLVLLATVVAPFSCGARRLSRTST